MKRASSLMFATAILLVAAVSAQTQTPSPTPGPEVKKLDYFVGNWTMDGDIKPGPMGPGGKMTGSETDVWMAGGFFVETHEKFMSPMANGTGLAVFGYNSDDKVYTYHSFDSTGQFESATGTLDGDTWSWISNEKMGGQTMKGRYTAKVLSPTSYAFKFELSPDGAAWTTVMEGKASKTK